MRKKKKDENPLDTNNTEYKPIKTVSTRDTGRREEKYERR